MKKAAASLISTTSLLLMLSAWGCSQTKFASGDARKESAAEKPSTPEPSAQPEPACTEKAKVTGAHLLFLLDNSGSMVQTDCPGGRSACIGETDREKALMLSFNVLSDLQAKYPDQTSAVSTISYAQFTPEFVPGYASKKVGLETKGAGRAELQRDIQFLRQPSGDTPYAGAVTQAQDLSKTINLLFPSDGKPRVAILVTDGEPTDRDPAQVLADIKAVRAGGLKWITVRVTNGQEKTARDQAHRQLLLNSYENANRGRTQPNGHWYAPTYANFDAYFTDIIALPAASSDQLIEIDTSDKLQKVILEEIIAKQIECVKPS